MDKLLFKSYVGPYLKDADTKNEAGGMAYQLPPKHALSQYVLTGCLGNTFYVDAHQQIDRIIQWVDEINDLEFVAKLAIYARKKAYMKDTPSLLVAILAVKKYEKLEYVFNRVVNSVKMLCNVSCIVKSGKLGRKNYNKPLKGIIKRWLNNKNIDFLFKGMAGNRTGFQRVLREAHPKPSGKFREAFFAFVMDKLEESKKCYLPPVLEEYIDYKNALKEGISKPIPDLPFQYFTSLPLTSDQWKEIARKAPWQMTRMNLNTFERHGVFKDDNAMVDKIAKRLSCREDILKSKAYPYQLFSTYLHMSDEIPSKIREAVQDAYEISTENVPELMGNVYIGLDVSGSMESSITGERRNGSEISCIQVASLIASTILRKNPTTKIIPFSDILKNISLNPRDTVLTNAKLLSALLGGGTDCNLVPEFLSKKDKSVDLLLMISDNQSWIGGDPSIRYTKTMLNWNYIKRSNPTAKMICLNIQPVSGVQAYDRKEDIFNISGFSDTVFDLIHHIYIGSSPDHFVEMIEKVSLVEPYINIHSD